MKNSLTSSTLIVIPAYNEQESLPQTVSTLEALDKRFNVLIVDDGSSDSTHKIAKTLGKEVLALPFNLGVGGAMRAGFQFALANGFSQVIQFDADGQHDAKKIPELLEALNGADIVVGARFAGLGDYKVSGFRWLAMQFLSKTLSFICKTKLTDATSGFKAYNSRALEVYSKNYPAEYLGDTIEALVIAAKSGLRVTQIPVEMNTRLAGIPSNSGPKAAVHLFRSIFAILVALSRKS